MTDAPERSDDRRRFLAKAGTAGAAAWVAPMILSTPASAATTDQTPPTEPPPCISCNSANVVNGSFEDGLFGWTSSGTVLVEQYSTFVSDPPPRAGQNFAAVVDPLVIGFPSSEGTLQQSLDVDRACAGLPFTLSFLSGVAPPAPGELPLYSVQFTGAGGELVGDTFTLSPPTMDDPYHFIPQSISGTVPDDATGVTLSFTGSDSAVDLVDFTICS
jgi:hypothetical protein